MEFKRFFVEGEMKIKSKKVRKWFDGHQTFNMATRVIKSKTYILLIGDDMSIIKLEISKGETFNFDTQYQTVKTNKGIISLWRPVSSKLKLELIEKSVFESFRDNVDGYRKFLLVFNKDITQEELIEFCVKKKIISSTDEQKIRNTETETISKNDIYHCYETVEVFHETGDHKKWHLDFHYPYTP